MPAKNYKYALVRENIQHETLWKELAKSQCCWSTKKKKMELAWSGHILRKDDEVTEEEDDQGTP